MSAPLLWVELSVLADCAERRDRRVIRGSKQVSDELVPVAVGVEDERDEVGAFLLSKECVLAFTLKRTVFLNQNTNVPIVFGAGSIH